VIPISAAAAVAVALMLTACGGEEAHVTKSDLQEWLEEGNSDNEAADPRCVLDPMWDAGLSDAELREFIDLRTTGEMPSKIAVYAEVRDACNADEMVTQCEAGVREPIECGDVPAAN
jgi:hypothetical protein